MVAHGGESQLTKPTLAATSSMQPYHKSPIKSPPQAPPLLNQEPIQIPTINQNEPFTANEIWSQLYRREPEKEQVKIHKSGLGEL